MFASTLEHEKRSLFRRHGAATNEPVNAEVRKFKGQSFDFLKRLILKSLRECDTESILDAQLRSDIEDLKKGGVLAEHDVGYIKKWVDSFPPNKRAPKIKELEKVEKNLGYLSEPYSLPPRECFPKREKVCELVSTWPKKYPDPRLIQGFDARTNIVLGPWITRIQHLLEHLLSFPKSDLVFACGMTGDQIGEYYDSISRRFTHFFEDDFTLYDTTLHKAFHLLAIKLFQWLGMPKYALKVRRAQISGTGRTVGGIQFSIDGTMKSGASDTCLTNSIINLLTHVYVLASLNGISMDSVLDDISMIVMGDDNIFCTNRLKVDGLRQKMAELGLLSKVQEKKFSELTFLNLMPMPTTSPRSWRAVLKPGRIMARIQASESLVKNFRSYQSGVALGMKHMVGGLPILDRFLDRLISMDKRATPIVERYYHRHLLSDVVYQWNPEEVKDWFCNRYKISLSSLELLEKSLEEFSFRGSFEHPTLDDIFRVDKVLL
jgi:hypothetical protein